MKVILDRDKESLIIEPATDFEADWLIKNYTVSNCNVFLKHGLSQADLIGLKIQKKEVRCEN